MLSCVKTYYDFVTMIPGERLVEEVVPIDHITGEDGGSGTSDAIVLGYPVDDRTEMTVVDLKGGVGVKVDAYTVEEDGIDLLTGEILTRTVPNEQAACYALGALRKFGWMGPFTHVRMVIVQPRLNHISEHLMTMAELEAFGEELKAKAEATRDPFAAATPGDKQCKFCRAKATCPELAQFVQQTVTAAFDDLGAMGEAVNAVPASEDARLSDAMRAAPLIEAFLKGVRAEVERRLLLGREVSGFKLVQGRRGNRQWTDEAEAETLLRKKFKLKIEDACAVSLKSPSQIEELLAKDHPRQWAKVIPLIVQPEGKPSVAPASDRREAIVVKPAQDVFNDLTTESASEVPAGLEDLF
jgi:hypothetical protein